MTWNDDEDPKQDTYWKVFDVVAGLVAFTLFILTIWKLGEVAVEWLTTQ